MKNISSRLDEFLQDVKQSLGMYDRDIVRSVEKLPDAKSTAALKRIKNEVKIISCFVTVDYVFLNESLKIERIRDEYKNNLEQIEIDFREEIKETMDSLIIKNDNFLNDLRFVSPKITKISDDS